MYIKRILPRRFYMKFKDINVHEGDYIATYTDNNIYRVYARGDTMYIRQGSREVILSQIGNAIMCTIPASVVRDMLIDAAVTHHD